MTFKNYLMEKLFEEGSLTSREELLNKQADYINQFGSDYKPLVTTLRDRALKGRIASDFITVQDFAIEGIVKQEVDREKAYAVAEEYIKKQGFETYHMSGYEATFFKMDSKDYFNIMTLTINQPESSDLLLVSIRKV